MADVRPVDHEAAVKERVRRFVLERFPLARQRALADTDSLLDSGIVDSLGILELVNFLQEEYGLEVSDEELMPDNFHSITSLSSFVERKRRG